MPAPGPIVTVCTANICRSPMAAALLQHALAAQPEPLRSIPVLSAGVAARAGEPVSENSVIALRKVGLDLRGTRSTLLTPELVRRASVLLCMTESHRSLIQLHFNPEPGRLYLFREFLPPGAETEIADPFGGPLRLYEAARDEMVEALPALVEFLRLRLRQPADA